MSPYFASDDDIALLQRKVVLLLFIVLTFVVIVGVRLYYLQIVRGSEYRAISEQISVREEELRAKRGLITDRNGKVLASSRSSHEIVLIPQDIQDKERLIQSVIPLIPITREEIISKLHESRFKPPFMPVVLVSDAPYDWIARVKQFMRPDYDEETPVYLQGLEIRSTSVRVYLYPELFSHALGYLKEVDPKSLKERKEQFPDKYSPGDYIGASGLEFAYDFDLKGEDGAKARIVDARGKEIRGSQELDLLRERLSFEPNEGLTLVSTLDFEAQEAASKALGDRKGAVVAVDPKTGEVLALYSYPTFDPNLISRNIDRKYWKKINLHPDKYLYNRAIQGTYPPGSTYKMVGALAGLETGKLNPATQFHCGGGLQFGNRFFRCWKSGGHGSVEVVRALTQSCDVYFYKAGLAVTVDGLSRYAHLLGLGEKTGIEIPYEQPGLIPSSQWKLKRYKAPWIESETLSISIGQGYDLVTPLQNARMVAMLANGGRPFKPHIGKKLVNPLGKTVKIIELPLGEPLFKEADLQLILQGMIAVVHGPGTARRLAQSPHKIAGKTGTSQVVGYESKIQLKDHALFVSFAPYDDPKIAVSVIVEHGGHGGSDAAPVAMAVIDAYLGKQ